MRFIPTEEEVEYFLEHAKQQVFNRNMELAASIHADTWRDSSGVVLELWTHVGRTKLSYTTVLEYRSLQYKEYVQSFVLRALDGFERTLRRARLGEVLPEAITTP